MEISDKVDQFFIFNSEMDRTFEHRSILIL